jgi:hypothetical protein
VERIEGLEQEQRDIMFGFRMNAAFANHTRLNQEQQRFLTRLSRPHQQGGRPRDEPAALLDAMLALSSTFGKPVS